MSLIFIILNDKKTQTQMSNYSCICYQQAKWMIDDILDKRTQFKWQKRLQLFFTWNTVSKLCEKVSKFQRGLSLRLSQLNFAPKTCIPKSAKMHMNRNRRTSREAIDSILPISDLNRLESDFQYLEKKQIKQWQKYKRKNVQCDRYAQINHLM